MMIGEKNKKKMSEQRPVIDLPTIVSTLDKLTDEWNRNPMKVSCEFCIHTDLAHMFDFLVGYLKVKDGKWIIRECETCRDHYGPDALHAEIVPVE